jgi:NADPH2:quinone reductase
MRAAVCARAGGPEVLEVRAVDTPEPGPGEVLVRIALAGLNPTDWKRIEQSGPAVSPWSVPGQDGAGTVEAVGTGVDPRRVGERVWLLLAAAGRRWGTLAEFALVPADQAIPLPQAASWELGASLGVPALTAWHCLRADGPLDGLSVLVAGGAGAVGHVAIELARFERASRVIATASTPEKQALARAAGASAVIDYRRDDAAARIRTAAPHGIDRVVEVDLAANLELDLAVAAPHAVFSAYAATPDTVARVPVRELMSGMVTLRFMLLYALTGVQRQTAIDGVCAAVEAGALTPPPVHRFPLAEAAAALSAVREGAVGKVVVDPTR